MNVVMLNAQAGTGAIGAAAGTAPGKSPQGGGFAGALVQALGGGRNAGAGGPNNAAVTPPLAYGLAGLLAQTQAQGEASDGDALNELLAGLAKLLQPQSGDDADADETTAASGDLLAQWLASLQALLAQANLQPQTDATEAAGSDAASAAQAPTGSQAAMLAALLPLLQQAQMRNPAAQASGQPNELPQPIAELLGQLQQSLASSASADQTANAASADPLPSEPDVAQTLTALLAKPAAQTAATNPQQTAAGQRKAAAAFKEPIFYFGQGGEDAELKPADAPVAVTAAGSAQTAGDQAAPYVWTPIGQPAAQANADAAKAALPAQVPVQQFTEQVGGYLVKQFALSGGEGVVTAKLSLHPEHLGQVDVRLEMTDGQLTAQFVAHNGTAKELIENQMSLLRASLQSQGIQVEKMEVVQQSDVPDQTAFYGQQQQESESDRGGGQSSKRKRDGTYEDPASFEAEMERTSALRDAGYGSSINVTA